MSRLTFSSAYLTKALLNITDCSACIDNGLGNQTDEEITRITERLFERLKVREQNYLRKDARVEAMLESIRDRRLQMAYRAVLDGRSITDAGLSRSSHLAAVCRAVHRNFVEQRYKTAVFLKYLLRKMCYNTCVMIKRRR